MPSEMSGMPIPNRDLISRPTISGGALVLDCNYWCFVVDHNANVTSLSFINLPVGETWIGALVLTQDATGGRTFTFPASCKFPDGASLTLTTTAAKRNRIMFITQDQGVTIDAHMIGKDYA